MLQESRAMNWCCSCSCFLALLGEKDFEGIAGIGVLLRSDPGNLMTAGSRFLLRKSSRVDCVEISNSSRMFSLLFGASLVIAFGCVGQRGIERNGNLLEI